MWNLLSALKTSLNASLAFHSIDLDESSIYDIYNKISNSPTDLCIHPQAISRRNIPVAYIDKIDFTNPHFMNNLVVIVPKPTIVGRWSYVVWNFFTKSIVLMVVMSCLFAQLDKLFTNDHQLNLNFFFFSTLRVPLQIKRKSTIKTAWLLFVLFFVIFLDNSFLNIILTDKYQTEIKTSEDLARSKLKVYAFHFKNYDPKVIGLPYSFVTVTKSKWKNLVFKNDGTSAFLASFVEIDRIMKYFARQHIDFNYKYLQDVCLPKFASLVVKARSPYLKKFGMLAAKVMEFGVSGTTSYKIDEILAENVRITYQHFIGVFVILIVGLTISSLVFLAELYWTKLRGNQ